MKEVDMEARNKPGERAQEKRKRSRRGASMLEEPEAKIKRTREILNVVYDALNSSASGVIITNRKGRIIYVNPSFLKIFGYNDKSEVLDKNATDLFTEQEVKRFSDVEAIIDESRGETEEFLARHRDGTVFPVEVSASNVTDRMGNVVGRMASFIDITERKRLEKELRGSEKKLRHLSQRILDAQEEERKLIAQELHDGIGASLSAIKYALERKLDEMGEARPPEGVSVEHIISMVKGTMRETSRISRRLRPSILDDLGVVATIRWFCRNLKASHPGVRIEEQLDVQRDEVPDHLQLTIYRVLQESLHNAVKHSGADRIRVSLGKRGRAIELLIEDNGQGFDLTEISSAESSTTSMGLETMKERTELVGGSLSIDSRRGKGTVIRGSWALG
jgi:PAS domain S-box-containing protein